MKDKISKIINKPVDKVELINPKRANHPSYRVDCVDGSTYRYDTSYASRHNLLQLMAWDAGINVPRVLKRIGGQRVCEWIEGQELYAIWDDQKEPIIMAGELMGQVNNIRCPWSGWHLIVTDINAHNFIWTPNKEIYLVDWNHSKLVKTAKSVDKTAAVGAMKRFGTRYKIELFLKGYSKHRDITKVKKIIEKNNYSFQSWLAWYNKNKNKW